MLADEVKSRIELEFERATKARAEGLEGRARVCARRAAGMAVREYLLRRQLIAAGQKLSVNEEFSLLLEHTQSLPEVQKAASALIQRVDEDFQLPPNMDLLAEAHWLVNKLETLSNEKENYGKTR